MKPYVNTAGLLFIIFLMGYLNINTGVHSDDYDYIVSNNLLRIDLDNLPGLIGCFPALIYDRLLFHFINDHLFLYDWVKILVSGASLYCVYRFMADYASKRQALVFSFLFLFFPTHDATNYWIVGQYMMITTGLMFLSHHLINHGHFIKGLAVGFLGSFYSYSSPPYTIGLSLLFAVKRKYKQALIYALPGFLYWIYYFWVTRYLLTENTVRDAGMGSALSVLKHLAVQMVTALDSYTGPSLFLKIYLSFRSLSTESLLVGAIGVMLWAMLDIDNDAKPDHQMLFSFGAIVMAALGIFALTGGYYAQIVFNLGNRVTLFGALVVSFLVVFYACRVKSVSMVLIPVLLFSVLGVSDHWKMWNIKQQKIIGNIAGNERLKLLDDHETLFLVNNGFSRMGPISHIEFLSEGTANSIVYFATGKKISSVCLSNRFKYESRRLIDTKYGLEYPIENHSIKVYDTETNTLFSLSENRIQDYLESLSPDNRHWIQLLNKENFLVKMLLTILPRLNYLFQ